MKSLACGNHTVEFDRRIEELETKVDNAQAVAVGDPMPQAEARAAAGRSAPMPGSTANDP